MIIGYRVGLDHFRELFQTKDLSGQPAFITLRGWKDFIFSGGSS